MPVVSTCFYQSWDYVCWLCVLGGLGMWHTEDSTSWRNDDCLTLPVLFRKCQWPLALPATSSSLIAPLTQMCHQLLAESEECCLNFVPYTVRLIVPVLSCATGVKIYCYYYKSIQSIAVQVTTLSQSAYSSCLQLPQLALGCSTTPTHSILIITGAFSGNLKLELGTV